MGSLKVGRQGSRLTGKGIQVGLATLAILCLSRSSAFVAAPAHGGQFPTHGASLRTASTIRNVRATETLPSHRAALAACAILAAVAARALSSRHRHSALPRSVAVNMMAVPQVCSPESPCIKQVTPTATPLPHPPSEVQEKFDFLASPPHVALAAPRPALTVLSAAVPEASEESVPTPASVPGSASRRPSPARFAGSARFVGARSQKRAGTSRGAQRTSRRAVGSRLQAVQHPQVVPLSFDSSLIRNQIQRGLQVHSKMSSDKHNREPKITAAGNATVELSTGVHFGENYDCVHQ